MSHLTLIPLVYFAAVLETALASHWEVHGAGPDLLVLVAFANLATATGPTALAVTALIGLVSDLGAPGPLGVGMATFALVGYCALWLRQRLDLEKLPGQLAMVWLAATSTTLLECAALRCCGAISLPWRVLFEHGLLVGLYTVGVAIPVLMILRWRGEAGARSALRVEG